MDFKTIIYGTRDGVAKITINRPERMNGYNEHDGQGDVSRRSISRARTTMCAC